MPAAPGIEASCRARAKVGILPKEKKSKLSSNPTVSANLPGIEARPRRHRSLQPAKPAPRSGFFPGKKNSRPPVGGLQHAFFLPMPPTWRHAADDVSYVITNYEAMSDYVGHWLYRAQVTFLAGKKFPVVPRGDDCREKKFQLSRGGTTVGKKISSCRVGRRL